MQNQQFCLRWNNHQNNMLRVFGRLLSNESLTDVTLCCDGRSVRVHKMVLSACSTYFEQLFLEHNEASPLLIILRDTPFSDLNCVIDFMYKGEVNVSQDNLNSLLKTAESLRIKGLSDVAMTSPTPNDDWKRSNTPVQANSVHQPSSSVHSVPNSASTSVITKPSVNNGHTNATSTPIAASGNTPVQLNDTVTIADWNAALSRKRGRPRKKHLLVPPPSHIHNSDLEQSFQPRIENVISTADNPHFDPEDEGLLMDPSDALDLSVSESQQPLKIEQSQSPEAEAESQSPEARTINNGFFSNTLAQAGEEPSAFFKGLPVYRYDFYTLRGTRQQFWEEPFTHAVMASVHEREMDLKEGAKLLGVSYGTLYGRYREGYGYLKHSWCSTRGRKRDSLGPANASATDFYSGRHDEMEGGDAEAPYRENDSSAAIPPNHPTIAAPASTASTPSNSASASEPPRPIQPKPSAALLAPLQVIKIVKKENNPGEPDQHYVTPQFDASVPFKKLRKIMIKPIVSKSE